MTEPKGNDYENQANQHLSRISDRYFFDSSSGLYIPRTSRHERQHQGADQPKKKNKWLPIEVRTDWAIFICTVATLVVISLYTWINGQMWSELKISADASVEAARAATDAIRISQENFQKEQRPFVFINAEKPEQFGDRDGTGNVQIVWTYHIRNFGKTPALSVTEHLWMKLGDGPYKPSYSPIPVKRYPSNLGQNDDHFSTVVSAPMTPAEANRLLSIDQAVRMKIELEYRDLFGIHFSTRECFGHLALGSTAICEGGYLN